MSQTLPRSLAVRLDGFVHGRQVHVWRPRVAASTPWQRMRSSLPGMLGRRRRACIHPAPMGKTGSGGKNGLRMSARHFSTPWADTHDFDQILWRAIYVHATS